MHPISILGLGNSGSSAVVEYLKLRGDVIDPLDGQEFCLLQEKGGLVTLQKAISSNFNPTEAMYALIEFKSLCEQLGRRSQKISIWPRLGLDYSRRLRNYDLAIKTFLTGITACTARRFSFYDKVNFTLLDWIIFKLGYMPTNKNRVNLKPFPVNYSVFEDKAYQLFKDLFETPLSFDFPKYNFYLLDQAGTFCAPVESTRYLGKKRKIIIVIRDPRDIFAERQRHGKSPGEFINEYNSMIEHIDFEQWSDERVMVVQFERFVNDHKSVIRKMCQFVGLDPCVSSEYNPLSSTKNIGKWKNILNARDSKFIHAKARQIQV